MPSGVTWEGVDKQRGTPLPLPAGDAGRSAEFDSIWEFL